MCFRMLSGKNAATIVNTASAIVRQAIALVFEHATVSSPPLTPGSTAHALRDAPNPPLATADPGTPHATDVPATSRSSALAGADAASADPSAAPKPAAAASSAAPLPREAASMLLRELCLMCRGHGSELLECRPLSVTFLLDVICEVLRTNVALFRKRGTFLEVLREDVCGTVLHILKGQLEADTEQVQVRSKGTSVASKHCFAHDQGCPSATTICANVLARIHRYNQVVKIHSRL